jgi:hypothetical protein
MSEEFREPVVIVDGIEYTAADILELTKDLNAILSDYSRCVFLRFVASCTSTYKDMPECSVGGALHILLDDGNFLEGQEDFIETSYYKWAKEMGKEYIEPTRVIYELWQQCSELEQDLLYHGVFGDYHGYAHRSDCDLAIGLDRYCRTYEIDQIWIDWDTYLNAIDSWSKQ